MVRGMRVIGSVPYLNARPLVRWFSATPEGRASGFEVVEAPPSELALLLERGEIECGLLSSIEWIRRPEFGYVPGLGISADGPVESVRLISQVPLDRVRSVALDTSSLTSVALLKLLLGRWKGIAPQYRSMAPDVVEMLRSCDAALLIGDRGFEPEAAGLRAYDLGALWRDWTGLPFVYALWIGPHPKLDQHLEQTLVRSKEWGLSCLPEIAQETARGHGTEPARALHYLSDIMRFDLDPRMREGLKRFAEMVRDEGLVSLDASSEDELTRWDGVRVR